MLNVVLRRVLPDWLAREPDNPYVAVFAPLLIDDEADLRARAPALWRTVQEAPLAEEVRDILSQVLEFWFFERFRGLTAKEVWAMLNLVTPIQETKVITDSLHTRHAGSIRISQKGRSGCRFKRASISRMAALESETPFW